MRGKGKSGATTAAKENAVNTVAKKAESTIEAVAEKAKEAVKKVEVKEEAVKETLAETKAEVKAEMKAVEKAAEPATAVTAAEAAPAKKTAARKTAAKSEPSTEVFIQYHGKQIDEKALLERVMQDCGEDKISVEDLKLYVKPEDNACYYVANGNVAGKVDLY